MARHLIQGCRFEGDNLEPEDLSEAAWQLLDTVLPAMEGRRGRPLQDRRATVNGILWRLRTGAPWRSVPKRYGNWSTIASCFRRWRAAGVWEVVAASLAETTADNRHNSIESTMVRGHGSAAGAKGELTNRILAARRAGSPLKFAISVTSRAGRSPSVSPAAKRRTAKAMTR
jgi:transposase